MIKQELRKLYLAKRMNLSPQEYADFNNELLKQFQTINFDNVKCVSLFLPMLERREPDTFLLVEWLKENHPNVQLAFPKSEFLDNSMLHFLEDNDLEIDTNNYGIPEPIKGNMIANSEIDMVIVPLLAVDKRGYRVGYGKGFYDRFMAHCKAGTQFIGLSFFASVDQIDDIDQYDMLLSQCVTPGGIIRFN